VYVLVEDLALDDKPAGRDASPRYRSWTLRVSGIAVDPARLDAARPTTNSLRPAEVDAGWEFQ